MRDSFFEYRGEDRQQRRFRGFEDMRIDANLETIDACATEKDDRAGICQAKTGWLGSASKTFKPRAARRKARA